MNNIFENHSHYDDKKFVTFDEKKIILFDKKFIFVKKFRESIIQFFQQNNELKNWFFFEMFLL